MSEVKYQLDIYNPAEFYAALGLLTVFSLEHHNAQLWSHFQVHGHAGDNNAALVIAASEELQIERAARELANASITDDKSANLWRNRELKNPALYAPAILSSADWSITLDWWLDDLRWSPENRLKLWSGNSTPVEMLKFCVRHGSGCVNAGGTLFGFDTRSNRDALQTGYSKKDTREKASLYPQTELLCAIGLQCSRPKVSGRQKLRYYDWQEPIPLSITHAAAIQEILGLPQSQYEFEVRPVGQGAKQALRATHPVLAAAAD